MHQVNVSEFRNHLPEYLARAEAGEEILVTRHGQVVARLSPARDPRADAKGRLEQLRLRARVGDVVSPVEASWEAAG
jgi:prevent-host-death family protein